MADIDTFDSFEAILQQRLQQHQKQLDVHRSCIATKMDWLSPRKPEIVPNPTEKKTMEDAERSAPQLHVPAGSSSNRASPDSPDGNSDRRLFHPRSAAVAPRQADLASSHLRSSASFVSRSSLLSGRHSNVAVPPAACLVSEGTSPSQPRHRDDSLGPPSRMASNARSLSSASEGQDYDDAAPRHAPHISEESIRLALKRRAEEGLAGLDIADALTIRDEKSKAEKWLRAQLLAERENPGRPIISDRAAAMPKSSVAATTSRLYQPGPSSGKALAILKHELEEIIQENVETTFHPGISDRAQQLQRLPHHSVFDDLYAQAVAQKDQREWLEVERRAALALERRSRTPHVDPMSARIAERLPETVQERLTRPQSPAASRRPSASTARSSSSATSLRRSQQLYEDHARRQARRLMAAASQDRLPEECTFQPAVNNHGKYSAPRSGRSASSSAGSGRSFHERAEVWERRRQARIEERQAQRAHDDLADCTFAPAVNPRDVCASDADAHPGFTEHLLRQQAARDIRDDTSSAASERYTYVTHRLPPGTPTTRAGPSSETHHHSLSSHNAGATTPRGSHAAVRQPPAVAGIQRRQPMATAGLLERPSVLDSAVTLMEKKNSPKRAPSSPSRPTVTSTALHTKDTSSSVLRRAEAILSRARNVSEAVDTSIYSL